MHISLEGRSGFMRPFARLQGAQAHGETGADFAAARDDGVGGRGLGFGGGFVGSEHDGGVPVQEVVN